jgi:hypothetical protein
MGTSTEAVRLRVETDGVQCGGVAIPKGDYDGYIDWELPHGAPEYRMAAVQLIVRDETPLKNMPCEVLRYLQSGDIKRLYPV